MTWWQSYLAQNYFFSITSLTWTLALNLFSQEKLLQWEEINTHTHTHHTHTHTHTHNSNRLVIACSARTIWPVISFASHISLLVGTTLETRKILVILYFEPCLNWCIFWMWYGKTRVTSYELRVTSWKLKSTSWKFKSTSWNSKVRVRIKSTSYEFESTSYEFESTSYEFESTSSRIIKNSMKTQVNSSKIISSKLLGNSWGFWW